MCKETCEERVSSNERKEVLIGGDTDDNRYVQAGGP